LPKGQGKEVQRGNKRGKQRGETAPSPTKGEGEFFFGGAGVSDVKGKEETPDKLCRKENTNDT